jgi:hypothetical protein
VRVTSTTAVDAVHIWGNVSHDFVHLA